MSYYTFDLSATKHKLRIRGGKWGDITDTSTTVVVGEAIDLSCGLEPFNLTLSNALTNFLKGSFLVLATVAGCGCGVCRCRLAAGGPGCLSARAA